MSQKYGQHFLIDDNVLMGIANTVAQTQQKCGCDRLIEIGPGEGVLTELIVDLFDHVTLYEIDETMRAKICPIAARHSDTKIVRGDVLETEKCTIMNEKSKNTLVVGNLPYYITSPILRKFFEPNIANPYPKGTLPLTPGCSLSFVPQDSPCIRGQQLTEENIYPGGVFLVQKEVAQKIASNAKKKSFLRWIVNYMYDVEYQFTVGPEAFNPPPKVDSAVFTLTRRNTHSSPLPTAPLGEGVVKSRPDYTRMMTFLDIVSGLKRKTLGKIRKMRKELLVDFVLPGELKGKRIEELGWEDMCMICGE